MITNSCPPCVSNHRKSNMLVQSKAGTGKTGCFVLGMLGLVDPTKKYTQAICLSPVHELAIQTTAVVKALGKHCPDIKVKCIIGGHKYNQRVREQIIVATPGKLVGLIRSKLVNLKNCKVSPSFIRLICNQAKCLSMIVCCYVNAHLLTVTLMFRSLCVLMRQTT